MNFYGRHQKWRVSELAFDMLQGVSMLSKASSVSHEIKNTVLTSKRYSSSAGHTALGCRENLDRHRRSANRHHLGNMMTNVHDADLLARCVCRGYRYHDTHLSPLRLLHRFASHLFFFFFSRGYGTVIHATTPPAELSRRA